MAKTNYVIAPRFFRKKLHKLALNSIIPSLRKANMYSTHHTARAPLKLFHFVSYPSLVKPKKLDANDSPGHCTQPFTIYNDCR